MRTFCYINFHICEGFASTINFSFVFKEHSMFKTLYIFCDVAALQFIL